jgi:hypothetical protein
VSKESVILAAARYSAEHSFFRVEERTSEFKLSRRICKLVCMSNDFDSRSLRNARGLSTKQSWEGPSFTNEKRVEMRKITSCKQTYGFVEI